MSHRKVQKFGSVWADGSAFEVASLFPRCCSRLASPTRVLRGASPERGHRSLRVGALASATEVSARSVSPLPSCLSRRRTREEVCSSVGAPALWRREGGFQPAARARWNDLLEPVGKDSSPSEDANKTSTRWPAAKCRAQWKGGKETPNIEVPEVCAVTENKEVGCHWNRQRIVLSLHIAVRCDKNAGCGERASFSFPHIFFDTHTTHVFEKPRRSSNNQVAGCHHAFPLSLCGSSTFLGTLVLRTFTHMSIKCFQTFSALCGFIKVPTALQRSVILNCRCRNHSTSSVGFMLHFLRNGPNDPQTHPHS